MHIRILIFLAVSSICVQTLCMDTPLAAEDMESGRISRIAHSVREWFTQAQYDDETIQGGIPGIRYIVRFHGGKCIIAGVLVAGGYLLYRNYKTKQQATKELPVATEEPDANNGDQVIESAKSTLVKAADYAAKQCLRFAHWIK